MTAYGEAASGSLEAPGHSFPSWLEDRTSMPMYCPTVRHAVKSASPEGSMNEIAVWSTAAASRDETDLIRATSRAIARWPSAHRVVVSRSSTSAMKSSMAR